MLRRLPANLRRCALLVPICTAVLAVSASTAHADWDISVSNAPDANINVAGGTITATGTGANISTSTLDGELLANNVFISTASVGAEPGTVTFVGPQSYTASNDLTITAGSQVLLTDVLNLAGLLDVTAGSSFRNQAQLVAGDINVTALAGWLLDAAVTSTGIVDSYTTTTASADVSAATARFRDDLTLAADVDLSVVNAAAFQRVNGAHALDIDVSSPVGIVFFAANVGSVTPLASLASEGLVEVGGGSSITTSGAQTYSGPSMNAAGFLPLKAGGNISVAGSLTGDGLSIDTPGTATFADSVSECCPVQNLGSGTLIVHGIMYDGVDLRDGEVRVTGILGSTATLAAGTRASGTGRYPFITGAGTVMPGNPGTAVGTLTALELTGVGVEIDITSSAADQIALDSFSPTAIQGGATVNFTAASIPAVGASYTIVDHAGTDPTPPFANLTEGARVAIGGGLFSATYLGGDGNDLVITRVTRTTTTSLAQSAASSTAGDAVTFTAAVASPNGTPAGSVEFRDGGTLLGSVALAGGSAKLTTSDLRPGPHSVTASFVPSGDFAASSSSAITHDVAAVIQPEPPVYVSPALAITIPKLSSSCVRPRTKDLVATYQLKRAAKVTYTLQRRASRTVILRSCPATPSKSTPGSKVSFRKVKAKSAALSTGAHKVRLSQLVKVRSLKPGVYRLLISGTATDGTKLTPKTVAFIVTAP